MAIKNLLTDNNGVLQTTDTGSDDSTLIGVDSTGSLHYLKVDAQGRLVISGMAAAFTPSHFPLPVLMPDVDGFTNLSANGATEYYILSGGGQDAAISFNMNLPAGTYDFLLYHFKGNDRGKYHLLIDGVDKGSIDGYNGSIVLSYDRLSGIVIPGASPTVVEIKMSEKNVSSGGYYGLIFEAWLVRTGA